MLLKRQKFISFRASRTSYCCHRRSPSSGLHRWILQDFFTVVWFPIFCLLPIGEIILWTQSFYHLYRSLIILRTLTILMKYRYICTALLFYKPIGPFILLWHLKSLSPVRNCANRALLLIFVKSFQIMIIVKFHFNYRFLFWKW